MDISLLKGVGPKTLKKFTDNGIYTTKDLLEYYPFRYDEIKRSNVDELDNDDKIIIDGCIESKVSIFFFGKKNKMSFKLNTGKYLLNVSIFNRAFLKNKLEIGKIITVIGKFDKMHNMVIASDIRLSKLPDKTIIEPIYHTFSGFTSREIRNFISSIPEIEYTEYIPEYLKEKYKLIDKKSSIINIHNPKDTLSLKQALAYLKYEELFMFMLKMNNLKHNKTNHIGLSRNVEYSKVQEFIDKLPFELTSDQLKCVENIFKDLNSSVRMNRLIQGDVGSGKTIVAIIALYINYLAGYEGALMAPTEVLAVQHYNNLKKLLDPFNIKVELLTGSLKQKEKKDIYSRLENHEIDIIVGTHALFSEDVKYNNLGLVITDEQHRFGVNQRANLKNKGITPDILYLSATPIPRTYALTIYGDMDVSNIHIMPSGRKEIITYLKKNSEIKDVLSLMLEEIKKGNQIYVIAPLIEESDKIDLDNVNDLYDKMNSAFSKICKVGIMHGKMDNTEKEKAMNEFKDGKTSILISTTVIEVGVDVKNATMIVIFDAFRFGLSQLHQLRGRVGRNSMQSYCVLISDKDSKRLDIMTKTNDGFKISEEDFMMRGSGDLFGIKQSGDMSFKVANIKEDFNILMKAKEDTEDLINNIDNYPILKQILNDSSNLD